jgi:hypothetical protein
MAVAGTPLTQGTGSSDPQNTASISPTGNSLILVGIGVYSFDTPLANAANITLTSVTGNGITYETVGGTNPAVDDGFGCYKLFLYRGLAASPSSGAVSINPSITGGGGLSQLDWLVAEFSGVDTGGSNGADAVVQVAANTTNENPTLTITLSAFADAGNGAFGFAVTYNNGTITHETNWTELDDDSTQVHSQWRADNDTTCTFVSSNGSDDLAGIAVEIKAAGGVEPPIENAPEVLRVVRSPIRFR